MNLICLFLRLTAKDLKKLKLRQIALILKNILAKYVMFQ